MGRRTQRVWNTRVTGLGAKLRIVDRLLSGPTTGEVPMTRFSHALRPLVAAASIVFAVACNSTYGDDGPTGNTGSIQVTANPSTLSLPQGGSGTITATLARGGGY